MAQTMTRSEVQNIPKPDLEQTAAQSTDAAQSPGEDVADLEPLTDELEASVKSSIQQG